VVVLHMNAIGAPNRRHTRATQPHMHRTRKCPITITLNSPSGAPVAFPAVSGYQTGICVIQSNQGCGLEEENTAQRERARAMLNLQQSCFISCCMKAGGPAVHLH
jgi:hypothetical protein